MILGAAFFAAATAFSGALDNAWLKGTTDKDPLSYKAGEEIVFTVTAEGLHGKVPEGYFLKWKRTDDYGGEESGRPALTDKPFIYKAKLDKPGFVRLSIEVVDANGSRYVKRFTGDATTPEGRKAMNEFERRPKFLFFDGGAGVDVDKLPPTVEPADFDAFWEKQFKRLDLVPLKAGRVQTTSPRADVKCYAVRVDCAGLRPVTGYLTVPVAVDSGKTFPARLETHGYSGGSCKHGRPGWARNNEIVFNINAHGLKLEEFGATEADTKALRWEIATDGRGNYAFDAKRNEDPETAYFNGMVLRVKRALQFLKTVKGWNGKDLYASGGSQGGLQTIWAAACGEGVTLAESGITWCCDMAMDKPRLERKIATNCWYIPWTESMGYYDAVNFAKRIPRSCRTVITRAGLGDYTCPPMGLAKLYNCIPDNKEIVWVQGSQHGYVPPAYEGRDWTRERNSGK